MRKTRFVNGGLYHVYNRGADKRSIFLNHYDYDRFLLSMREFNRNVSVESIFVLSFEPQQLRLKHSKPLVEIVSYCLNPNHYHFLLRQVYENGVSNFIKKVAGGYTKYFNGCYKRSGVLFQGKFKAVAITTNEQLLRTSVYINLNDRVHRLRRPTSKSSWNEYIERNKNESALCSKEIILDQFNSKKEYRSCAEEALEQILEEKAQNEELRQILLED